MVMHHHPELSVRRQCVAQAGAGGDLLPSLPGGRDERRADAPPGRAVHGASVPGLPQADGALRAEGHAVNGKRVRGLLKRMGLQAIYPKPDTSRPHPAHPVYPYLLDNITIIRPNQVWATDITYIRLAKGFGYLVAVMDWYSRYVLAWKLSGTMECGFCVETLQAALTRGTPDIFNTDQGSQFTATAFITALAAAGVRISMDGKGSYHDNIFTERLWRSVKYEEVYLKEYSETPR